MSTLLLVLSLSAFGQPTDNEKAATISNAEKFSQQPGIMLQKEFIDLGSVDDQSNLKVQLAIFTDLFTNTTVKGVRIEAHTDDNEEDKVAFIDADELDGTLLSIRTLQDHALNTSPTGYVEAMYTSRSTFCIGAFYTDSLWHPYIETKKDSMHTFVRLNTIQLNKMFDLFSKAKNQLQYISVTKR